MSAGTLVLEGEVAETAPLWGPLLLEAGEALAATLLAPEVVIPVLVGVAIVALTDDSPTCQTCPYANSGGSPAAPNVAMNESTEGSTDSSGGPAPPATPDAPATPEAPTTPDTPATPDKKFADDAKKQDHYDRHGNDFGATSADEYEQQANEFLNGPKDAETQEKTRANGDKVRFNPKTDEFGVTKSDGTIKTYYKPDPAVHGKPTNQEYFDAQ